MFESLEARRLFTVTAIKDGAFLRVNGDNANDAVAVVENNGAVQVIYADSSGLHTGKATDPKSYFTGIDAILINGGGGSDLIAYTGNSRGAVIHGDNVGSSEGSDLITVSDIGIAGSTVDGDGAADAIFVVHSHDTFIYGGEGNDVITLLKRDLSETTNVFAEAGKDTVITFGGTNYIEGGDGKDLLIDCGGNNSAVGFEVVLG